MAKAKKCAGIIQSGARKGSVKSNYRKQPGDRCPVKLSAGGTRRRKSASSCKDIAKRAFKAGIAKGRKLQAAHKPTPKNVAQSPASYSQQAAAIDRIYGRGMAGLGGTSRRRRRRRRSR